MLSFVTSQAIALSRIQAKEASWQRSAKAGSASRPTDPNRPLRDC
jgi:hypothetical protein